jgi:alpha-D-xyloside xylohydrolase
MEQFENRLNQPPDPRADFLAMDSFVFVAQKLAAFDPERLTGALEWARHRRKPRIAFNHMTMPLEAVAAWEFPANYPEPKSLPFELSFVDARTFRLRLRSRPGPFAQDEASIMLAGPAPSGAAHWKTTPIEGGFEFASPHATLTLRLDPWSLSLADRSGKLIWATHNMTDGRCMIDGRPVPFSFARRSRDLAQNIAASFRLSPGEKIFGCGESFSDFDKRGQSVFLFTQDAHGSQTDEMYKPIPFYLSSRGYGAFVHGSTPMLFDFGHAYGDTGVLYTGDDALDLFIFVGEPAEVLESYTTITGRSPLAPVWSFGLWMSRITYSSEAETRQVAAKLREHQIPYDVIHLDTG